MVVIRKWPIHFLKFSLLVFILIITAVNSQALRASYVEGVVSTLHSTHLDLLWVQRNNFPCQFSVQSVWNHVRLCWSPLEWCFYSMTPKCMLLALWFVMKMSQGGRPAGMQQDCIGRTETNKPTVNWTACSKVLLKPSLKE